MGNVQICTWFKHDGLLQNPTAMGIEFVYADWLAVQAEYVVEEGVSVNFWSISGALRVLRNSALPEASCSLRY